MILGMPSSCNCSCASSK